MEIQGKQSIETAADLTRASGTDVTEERAALLAKFAGKTDAVLTTGAEFKAVKEAEGLHVVGVTGFSGQWSEQKLAADPALNALAEDAKKLFEATLAELKSKYGSKLIVSSGATMEGVPKIVYDTCEAMGIAAMGVTSEKAADYPLGKMAYLVVEGKDWGDESRTFIETSDRIVMIGGGGQAKREAIAAASEGKPVTVFQGYGGTADQLSSSDIPSGVFVARH